MSKFTEFTADKLYKIYKHALKKQEENENQNTAAATSQRVCMTIAAFKLIYSSVLFLRFDFQIH